MSVRIFKLSVLLFLACIMLAACNKPEGKEEPKEESSENAMADTLIIRSDEEKLIEKTFTVNGYNTCRVTVKKSPNNDIVNAGGGYKYYDNTAEVKVIYNDKDIFHKTIRKADFKDSLDSRFYKVAVLFYIGLESYNDNEIQIHFSFSQIDTDWFYAYIYHIRYDGSSFIEEIPYEEPGEDDFSHEPQAEEEKFEEKSFMVNGSNTCKLTIKRFPNSDIVYGDGDYQYYDNTVEIKVVYNEKEIFNKPLRRADFKDKVDPDFYENAVLYHIDFESYTDDEIKIRFYLSQYGSDWYYGYMYHIRYDGSSYIEELPYEEPGAEEKA